MYKINEVAKALNISTNKIRFYEKKELLNTKRNEDNNYRYYNDNDIKTLQLILIYRKLGFSIEYIHGLLQDTSNKNVLNLYFDQYQLLNKQIHSLNKIRSSLELGIDDLLEKGYLSVTTKNEIDQSFLEIEQTNLWKDRWDFDDNANDYDELVTKQLPALPFYKHYEHALRKCAKLVNNTDGKVIEIGIGTGNLAKQIYPYHSFIGIDQSREMLIIVKHKYPNLKVKIGTFLQLPLEDHSYDCIVSSYAFHHNTDKEKALAIKEMNRVLTKNGRIVICDVMFKDINSYNQYYQASDTNTKRDLNDEYFTIIEDVEVILKQYGYTCKYTQIDDIVWIIEAKNF